MPGISDKERMERTASEAARVRDIELKRAEESYQHALDRAKEEYAAAVSLAEKRRKAQRDHAFLTAERRQDAVSNFIDTKNDAARIRGFGLGLPFIHPTNTFGRKTATDYADCIAAARKAGA